MPYLFLDKVCSHILLVHRSLRFCQKDANLCNGDITRYWNNVACCSENYYELHCQIHSESWQESRTIIPDCRLFITRKQVTAALIALSRHVQKKFEAKR